jgi:dienelactone hydrolase
MSGKAAKYGNIDTSKIAIAGYSCGGLEAISTGYHNAMVKLMILFNIATFEDDKRYLYRS